MKIHITKIRPNAVIPTYGTPNSGAFDLAAAETITIEPLSQGIVPTGLVMCIPEGHVMHVFPRSSTFQKFGIFLSNGVAVIDSDYCGPTDELMVMFYNPGDKPVTISSGTRIAQAIIYPRPKIEFEEGAADGPSRGGFGSTG
ncbi:MAG: dUTP diphosphatase [Patescibacteria group bacterium]|nr:dUTP diphosphatase [Patescibacteria group bacterium]MBU2509459.1 dUTP diphosphatase [Patescibacteria group bacterium]